MTGLGQGRTMTKSKDAVAATLPPTLAVPWPLPAMAPSWSSSTASSRVSPGTTWRRKRALSMPPNRGKVPGETGVTEHGDATQLGHRLHHQHSREGRAAREVALEEGFFTGEAPDAAGRAARLERGDLVHEKERGPVGQHAGGLGQPGGLVHPAGVNAPSPGRRRRAGRRR